MKSFAEIESHFSSAHFYSQAQWSAEKNQSEFGRCYTPYGHGHNYRLIVSFEIPAEIQDLQDLESWPPLKGLRQAVFEETDRLDHQHLNFVIPEFQTQVPTTENIAKVLMERLQARALPFPVRRLRLYEMDDLWVEVES